MLAALVMRASVVVVGVVASRPVRPGAGPISAMPYGSLGLYPAGARARENSR
ncbi:hypothetical protein [Brachybacterium sacelli]|uniref:hypothetical protein n=1 Tax=Brachybacterium sacelli TaxID=173364 RepID=UPI00361FF4E6